MNLSENLCYWRLQGATKNKESTCDMPPGLIYIPELSKHVKEQWHTQALS